MSLFSNLYLGTSGLRISSNALNTTAHNITNVDTDGYTRQQVSLATTLPNGKYKDALTGKVFSVKKGIIHGQLDAQSAYLLIKK